MERISKVQLSWCVQVKSRGDFISTPALVLHLDEILTHHNIPMAQPKPLFIPWLKEQIDSGRYPGVQWVNQEGTKFSIPWKHALRQDSNSDDILIFKAWAQTSAGTSGQIPGDHSVWKRNFRSALRARGFKIVDDNKNDAANPHKIYMWPENAQSGETMALGKRQEVELEAAELKMLRFSLGVTRMDKIRNEFIRGTAHVGCFGDKVREARLRWFGHVQRRDMNYIGRRMLRMEPPGRRKRGRPRRRFMDVVREDTQTTISLVDTMYLDEDLLLAGGITQPDVLDQCLMKLNIVEPQPEISVDQPLFVIEPANQPLIGDARFPVQETTPDHATGQVSPAEGTLAHGQYSPLEGAFMLPQQQELPVQATSNDTGMRSFSRS
ncbi:interferon regulatory factor 3 isoform X1 [Silurus asotus]|uniref:Interferon regulatory factor 3 isoform X1 n=1 Tax=Silurus asotus TaxID=30991 RepID=A0AAD5A5C1_SILAS|nr:interferon regulatory factor 3 isoform X1 [Silurus asotus]